MSELYRVEVKERDVTIGRVAFHVEVINSDAGEPEADFAFAFQLLHDYLRAVMLPWSKAPWGTKREDLPPIPDVAPALQDEFPANDMIDESRLIRECSAYISDVEWKPDVKLLVVTPTHPAWTEQCRVGLAFGTAAYTTGYGCPPSGKRVAPLKPIDRQFPPQPVDDVMQGFVVKKPKNKDIVTAIPLAVQSLASYIAVPIEGVTTGAVTKDLETLRTKLLHVPVMYKNWSNTSMGTVIEVAEEDGVIRVAAYHEGDIMHMTERFSLDGLHGRAVLVKPRPRVA